MICVYKTKHSQESLFLQKQKYVLYFSLLNFPKPRHLFPSSSDKYCISEFVETNGINGEHLSEIFKIVWLAGIEKAVAQLSPHVWMNSRIPRWNRGLSVAIWSFQWFTYLCLIFVSKPFLLGETREAEMVCGWRCVGVFTMRRVLVAYDEWDS